MAITKWRREAIERLGGVYCAGLSFIGGPECPVPKELLTIEDINIGHRVGLSGEARQSNGGGGGYYKRIAHLKNPKKTYINLCVLCNQRMRHLAKEFGFKKLPKKAIDLYENHLWSLQQIAERYDCADSTVSKFLKRSGIKVRLGATWGPKRVWSLPKTRKILQEERRTRWLTPERIKTAKQMSKMYDEGDSLRDVAHWFSVSKGSVRAHLQLIGEL